MYLGKMFGVSFVTVSTWESGRTMPSPEIIEGLCVALHCRKEELVNLEAEQGGYLKMNAS